MELVAVLGEGDQHQNSKGCYKRRRVLGCILVLSSPLSFIFGELDVILDVFLPLLTQFRACLEKKEIICLHRLSVPKTISGGNKIKQSKNSMHWKQNQRERRTHCFMEESCQTHLAAAPHLFVPTERISGRVGYDPSLLIQ